MQGADIHTVATVLGHKDLRMAARYQHLSPEFLSQAVGRLDSIFGEPAQLPAETGNPASDVNPSGTTSSHEISATKPDITQVVGLIGSAIGYHIFRISY